VFQWLLLCPIFQIIVRLGVLAAAVLVLLAASTITP